MKRVLYIDRSFKNEIGGDKNRSRYLYSVLQSKYSTHCCIALWPGEEKKDDADLYIETGDFKKPLMPYAILNISNKDVFQVMAYIKQHNISIVFVRTIAFAELVNKLRETIPHIKVIVDVDLLLSRLMKQAWSASPSLKNRFYLIQWVLLHFYEAKLFQRDYMFLLTNQTELDELRLTHSATKFEYLQNTTDLLPEDPGVGKLKEIVFYGSMDSSANAAGYRFIVDRLYPLVEDYLYQQGYSIIIAGKGCEKLPVTKHKCLKVVGKVESIEDLLKQSAFVLLPIFIASGTNTRVIESSMAGRAVLTTPLAMEGLVKVVNQDYIVNDEYKMTDVVKSMIQDAEYTIQLASDLQQEILKEFSFKGFGKKVELIVDGC